MESSFGMPIFYIIFCHYQLNLDTVMNKKLVLYEPLLKKQINLGIQLKWGRVGGFPYHLFGNRQKVP